MTLLDAEKNREFEVVDIAGDKELKQRLLSFGISRGTHVKVVAFGAMRSTINIEIEESGCVALRHSEASAIKVTHAG